MAEQTAEQRDAAALEHQAHEAHRDGKHGTAAGKKIEAKFGKHATMIGIAISLVGVVIAYAQWKGKQTKKAAAAAGAQFTDPTNPATDPTGGAYLPVGGSGSLGSGSVGGSGAGDPAQSVPDWTTALTGALGQQQQTALDAQAAAIRGQQQYLTSLSHELGLINGNLTGLNRRVSALPPAHPIAHGRPPHRINPPARRKVAKRK